MSTPNTDKKLFSVKETAVILGVSERSIWAVTAPRGNLVSCKIGCRVLYSRLSIERFIAQQENENETVQDA